jgi:Arc/MetJ-type ribon-helix-helix transcriptional regulator
MEERPQSKLTVMIPYNLRKEFKIACEQKDRDMSEVVRKLIRQWLEEQQEARRAAGQK